MEILSVLPTCKASKVFVKRVRYSRPITDSNTIVIKLYRVVALNVGFTHDVSLNVRGA